MEMEQFDVEKYLKNYRPWTNLKKKELEKRLSDCLTSGLTFAAQALELELKKFNKKKYLINREARG